MTERSYCDKEGSMECLALLMDEPKTTPELIESVATSENTVRKRINEGIEHGYIEQMKTYSSDKKYRLIDGSIPNMTETTIFRLKNIHEKQDSPDQLHRDQFNDHSDDGGHIDSPFGNSYVRKS